MRYLLDTNILIFYATDGDYISREVGSILDDAGNLICISSESLKEVFHLLRSGKIQCASWKSPLDVFRVVEKWGFTVKYLHKEHLETLARLVPRPNHNDPSDHAIIAQAITEKMTLISSDRKFEQYRTQGLDFIYNKR
jgi:PIN domain nuclease of toxin-antitoxin system